MTTSARTQQVAGSRGWLNAEAARRLQQGHQLLAHLLAFVASAALVWLAQSTLAWCLGHSGGCGTPCVSSVLELSVAPLLLTLPFLKLLWSRNLSRLGLAARCAVTSGITVWSVSMVVLQAQGQLF